MSANPPEPQRFEAETFASSVADFHGADLIGDGRRRLVFAEPEAPALVLGSTQADIAAVLAAAGGPVVVMRRSGGGAVLVDEDVCWFDVVIGRGDPLWSDDVGAAMEWIGVLVASVLQDIGLDRPVVHTGHLRTNDLGRLVCFASLGSGEVTVGRGRRKIFGISQRRTRAGARFQCALLIRWRPTTIAGFLAPVTTETPAALALELEPLAVGLADLATEIDVRAALAGAFGAL